MAVESTSALLTQAFVAVIDKYKELAKDIVALMELLQQQRQVEKLGYLSEDLSQAIIACRVNIDDRHHEIQDLEAILNSALLSLEAASEAAFQAGQEELSMMGRDRCQYANTQLAITQSVIKKAEQALASLQADSIRDTQTEKEDKK